MKIYRKTALFSLFFSLVFYLTGCSISEFQKSIYNDDSKIVKQADSYSFKSRIGSTTNEKSDIKFATFYGMDTLWSVEAKEETIVNLEYDLKIEKGDFKVILVSPDNKVSTLVYGTKAGQQDLKLQKGSSRIKIVGRDAKGQVKLYMKGDKGLKIKSK